MASSGANAASPWPCVFDRRAHFWEDEEMTIGNAPKIEEEPPVGQKVLDESVLEAAAAVGDLELVEKCVRAGLGLEDLEDGARSALEFAAAAGHAHCLDAMFVLAWKGRRDGGFEAFLLAAMAGKIECVRVFLQEKWRVSWSSGDFDEVMEAAGSRGFADCLEECLLVAEADGREALSWETISQSAGFGGDGACLGVLMRRGRLVWERALLGAAEAGHGHSIDMLLSSVWEVEGPGVERAVNVAAGKGFAGCVERLMAACDPARREEAAYSGLRFAAKSGAVEVVKLLSSRCDASGRSFAENGSTPLMCAASSRKPGSAQCVEYLLPLSDLRRVDHNGRDPLMRAARSGFPKSVELLLGRFSGHWVDKAGMDALMHAACRGDAEAVGLLLDWSDASRKDSCGATALMWAAKKGAPESVAKLLSVSNPLERSERGLTALIVAAWRGKAEAVRMLMDVSDPSCVDVAGVSASGAADRLAWSRNSDLVGMLAQWEAAGRERAELWGVAGDRGGAAQGSGVEGVGPLVEKKRRPSL